MGPRGFFPTNPDLADILGRMDLDFEIFYVLDFFSKFSNPTFLEFQVPKSPNSQISRFPDFQTPPAPPDELSDPNLTPLPTHPGIKYVAGSPCCHFFMIITDLYSSGQDYSATMICSGKDIKFSEFSPLAFKVRAALHA